MKNDKIVNLIVLIMKERDDILKVLIATLKSWNIEYAKQLQESYKGMHQVKVITDRKDLNKIDIDLFQPDYIFFPHWSYFIPNDIYDNYECVVFHMTDLPFGRGGSPLQNLISKGYETTKISAIKVVEELDAGPIYMKEPLELLGSAEEIFRKASKIIYEVMIPKFLNEKIYALPQEGTPVIFKRRTSVESEIKKDFDEKKIYDYIRMLDAEGYPKAFLEYGDYRLEFSKAVLGDNEVYANVVFRRKENE